MQIYYLRIGSWVTSEGSSRRWWLTEDGDHESGVKHIVNEHNIPDSLKINKRYEMQMGYL